MHAVIGPRDVVVQSLWVIAHDLIRNRDARLASPVGPDKRGAIVRGDELHPAFDPALAADQALAAKLIPHSLRRPALGVNPPRRASADPGPIAPEHMSETIVGR